MGWVIVCIDRVYTTHLPFHISSVAHRANTAHWFHRLSTTPVPDSPPRLSEFSCRGSRAGRRVGAPRGVVVGRGKTRERVERVVILVMVFVVVVALIVIVMVVVMVVVMVMLMVVVVLYDKGHATT